MNVTIQAAVPHGTVSAPPSKSMAHRLLLGAALADGESTVGPVAPSDDLLATLDCLRALGATVTAAPDGGGVWQARIRGTDPAQAEPAVLPCRSSASTLRFLLPLCLLSGRPATLTGSAQLLSRPLAAYEALCRAHGFFFEKTPTAVSVCGRLQPGAYTLPGDCSSQFASGLLFALPLLHGQSTLRLLSPVESRPYLEMTCAALAEFGIVIQKEAENLYKIPGNQRYLPHDCKVEGDWSSAAVLATMNATGGRIRVQGLGAASLQGDAVCVDALRRLRAGFAELALEDCPDLGPVLFAAAAALHGGRFTGIRRLRYKESDRVAAMQQALAAFGILLEADENTATVFPAALRAPDRPLWAHDDHRVAMALSVLLCKTGGTLTGAEAVQKSWPGYWDVLRTLHVPLKQDTGAEAARP